MIKRAKQGDIQVGDRIYYTGDMANMAHWCVVDELDTYGARLKEENRPFMTYVTYSGIGLAYEGHGNPRFYTEAAFNEWKAEKIAMMGRDRESLMARGLL